MSNTLALLEPITTLIFDVDGVFTNSQLLITEKGELLRSMNARDGYAVRCALQAGLHIAIITGGKSEGVKKRLQGLGIVDIYYGIQYKPDALEEYVLTYDVDLSTTLYMGDDMPDYEVMQKVGVPCCPADAAPEIMSLCQYVSPFKGGEGCVRDIIEKVLKLKGQW